MHDDEQRALFAKNLNARMGAQGRTQADVMRAMNVGRATVSEWCRGTKLPRIEKLAELANWLGVSKAELMGWGDGMTKKVSAADVAPGDVRTLGGRIRTHRQGLGLTQSELAEWLGVEKNAVSKWETGRVTDIPTGRLRDMAALFGVQLSVLVDGPADWPPADEVPKLPEFHTRGEYLTQSTSLTLGDFVRQRRTELGLTQQQVADLLGYTDRSSVARLEAGEIDLPVSRIPYLAKALQCPPEVLVPDEAGMLHPWREK